MLAGTGLGSSASHLVLGPGGSSRLALFPCWCRKEESLTTSGALAVAQRGDEESFFPPSLCSWLAALVGLTYLASLPTDAVLWGHRLHRLVSGARREHSS